MEIEIEGESEQVVTWIFPSVNSHGKREMEIEIEIERESEQVVTWEILTTHTEVKDGSDDGHIELLFRVERHIVEVSEERGRERESE